MLSFPSTRARAWHRLVCARDLLFTLLTVAACAPPAIAALTPQIPGLTRTERSLSATEVERGQLPPTSAWRRFSPEVPAGLNGLCFAAPAKPDWAFYARRQDGSEWRLVSQDPDGTLVCAGEAEVTVIAPNAAILEPAPALRWYFFRRGLTVEYGGCVLLDLPTTATWEFFWLNLPRDAPLVPAKLYRPDLEDGFVRLTFAENDRWTIRAGAWTLKQYGGGMPTNEQEARSPHYRRAANAFTLVGSNGEACCGRNMWTNFYAEASFFFGRPDSYAKRDTLTGTTLGGEPTYANRDAIYHSDQIREFPEADFFLVQGIPGSWRFAFGWAAAERRFELRRKTPGRNDWDTLRFWPWRPLFSNWIRIGLGVARGCRIMPFLDGEQLGAYPADGFVRGPVAVLAGDGRIELDDVRVWAYPKPYDPGAPAFEQSVHFAQKELLPQKDEQTGQWTRSELTFEDDQARLRGRDMHLIRCQFPIFGDFTYTAGPALPPGEYCFALVDDRERPYYLGFFDKTAAGWDMPGGKPDFELKLGRRKKHVVRRVENRWKLLSNRRVSATAWLVLGAKDEAALTPNHHLIFSKCLSHDFFERAPTDWVWREGNFRMDVRWQCQRGWNFMMGKSRDVAVMYSKTAHSGDQEIEFHMALRFCMPPPYYVLRDMGFAFCTDGKSIASGYALIYGDQDNRCTTLLREGVPIARSEVTIRPASGGTIHNYWWHGKVTKRNRTITVELDNQKIFEYTDRRVLPGGHIAFWTFRNAISLAKVSVNAERSERRPELFRLPSEPEPQGPWRVLSPDAVALRRLPSGRWQAKNLCGGGTFALRWDCASHGIDLKTRPWLIVPLKQSRDARLGLHVQISGRSYYYPVTAPDTQMRYLLTPEFETAEPEKIFTQSVWTEDDIDAVRIPGRHNNAEVTLDCRAIARSLENAHLESITIGNSSNQDYLLLGASGNGPGTTYTVGIPFVRR